MRDIVCSVASGLAVPLLAGVLAWAGPAPAAEPRVVPRDEIAEAMRHSRGYNLEATAHGPRLQAEVLLRLIRIAERTDGERRPLRIGHEPWFSAFLARTGLSASQAPLYVRLPREIGQDIVADYRRERVVARVREGPEPRTVANVCIFWEDGPGKPRSYSYDDLLSNPTLRVTQKQRIRYRLVDYGDRLWYAQVDGLWGRPTSGALGLLFDILGEARVLESRSVFSPDGFQVVRGRGRKLLIERDATVTIWPDGHADKGVPRDRPDLQAFGARLREPLGIDFVPLDGETGDGEAGPPSPPGRRGPRTP